MWREKANRQALREGFVLALGGHVEAVDTHEGAGLAALDLLEAGDLGHGVVDAGLLDVGQCPGPGDEVGGLALGEGGDGVVVGDRLAN